MFVDTVLGGIVTAGLFLGEARVNVLALNLALDGTAQ